MTEISKFHLRELLGLGVPNKETRMHGAWTVAGRSIHLFAQMLRSLILDLHAAEPCALHVVGPTFMALGVHSIEY